MTPPAMRTREESCGKSHFLEPTRSNRDAPSHGAAGRSWIAWDAGVQRQGRSAKRELRQALGLLLIADKQVYLLHALILRLHPADGGPLPRCFCLLPKIACLYVGGPLLWTAGCENEYVQGDVRHEQDGCPCSDSEGKGFLPVSHSQCACTHG